MFALGWMINLEHIQGWLMNQNLLEGLEHNWRCPRIRRITHISIKDFVIFFSCYSMYMQSYIPSWADSRQSNFWKFSTKSLFLPEDSQKILEPLHLKIHSATLANISPLRESLCLDVEWNTKSWQPTTVSAGENFLLFEYQPSMSIHLRYLRITLYQLLTRTVAEIKFYVVRTDKAASILLVTI